MSLPISEQVESNQTSLLCLFLTTQRERRKTFDHSVHTSMEMYPEPFDRLMPEISMFRKCAPKGVDGGAVAMFRRLEKRKRRAFLLLQRDVLARAWATHSTNGRKMEKETIVFATSWSRAEITNIVWLAFRLKSRRKKSIFVHLLRGNS